MWLAFGSLTRELRDGEVVVGSGADADWRVSTADLLPRHFTVLVYGLNASLRPTLKESVVVVNGKQLVGAPHLLNDGDVIEAGSGRFVYSEGEPRVVEVPATAPARAYLVDDAAKVAHAIVNRSTTIGRDTSNAIVVADPRASRFHAEIRREAGGFALHSMGSAGTVVNGKLLEAPCLLAEGDTIQLAYANFRFSRSEPAGISVAGTHDESGGDARRRPTLTTGKLPLVAAEPDRRVPRLILFGIAVVVAVAVVAWLVVGR